MIGRKPERHRRRAPGLSREEAETLCLLRLIGKAERSIPEVCSVLGVSAWHGTEIAQVFQEMAARGEIELIEDRVSLTDSGRERMEDIGAKIALKPRVVRAKGKKPRPASRGKLKKKRK